MDETIIEENKDKIINNTEEDEEAEIDNSFVPVYHSFPVKDEDSHQVVSAGDYRSILASKDGDFLLSSTGAQVKVSDLESKVVGLYFSANWYPPCTKFTDLLINVYEQLKDHSDPGFEIVFVSSDEDLDAFNTYKSSMPWLAIPFSDLETRRALTQKFDVEGIPCLIILQPNNDAAVISDGVELVYRYGVQAFPFTKERLEELKEKEKEKHDNQTLSNLLTRDGRDYLLGHPGPKQVPVASLMGKTIGLYFSAQWCIPAFKFTPRLMSVYQKIKQQLEGKEDEDFEIVFVSSDRNQVQFMTYFETMPWLAVQYDDPTIKNLAKYFDIRGIPSLVVLGPDGKTVTKQGRSLINLYKENAYPFTKTRVGILEKQMDEVAKGLPKTEHHPGHRHELTLVPEGHGGGAFICCDCDEQGYGWAYQCLECGYEVHPKCMKPVARSPDS
ncbi:PREDICTED: probable nucleoredoxin 2 isoform X2 [Nicotiana attenuata]|uniref:protein-disulfide reductase n=1 Tax=Nicotiana attenuata TaxID=49451 RepID=A0A1J6IYW1_NICAT|nr:PREDICTED: probable nucleoredoxin 2 isoform X2 [Nicotiana attenuata]OIT03963.1 putative nucleoredoxin 2 [Nicotiana attenuata]